MSQKTLRLRLAVIVTTRDAHGLVHQEVRARDR